MSQSRSVTAPRLLARNAIEERLEQLIAHKTLILKHVARKSSGRNASLVVVNTSSNFEMDLQHLLDEEL